MSEHVLTERMVEEELSVLQSLSGNKSAYAGEEPSRRMLEAVHTAAVRSSSRRLFVRRVFLFAKVAAVFALLLGAAWYLAGAKKQSKAPPSVLTVNAASFSEEELLLDIQGMDDESFFSQEEEVFLL